MRRGGKGRAGRVERVTNFEKITASPEAMAEALEAMEPIDGPWDAAFTKRYCSVCKAKNCEKSACLAPEICKDARTLISWWLGLEAEA